MTRSTTHHPRPTPFWPTLALALFVASAPALAQVRSSANYAITVDGVVSAGGTASSANYTQRFSFAQAFETPPMVGVNYNSQGGLQAAQPDTQAPGVPGNLAAIPVSTTQINLTWNASTDNVAVTLYRVFRGGVLHGTVGAPTVGFSDTGLTPGTTYTYTVAACDPVGNCSAQSAPVSATAGSTYTANLELGFNLIGNSLNITLNVPATFGNQDAPVAGVTSGIVSIWKWNALNGRWAFYSPLLTVADIASFAASKGYEVLSVINPGEGYWVNAIGAMTLPAQTGADFNWTGSSFGALPLGFNLIAHATTVTPSQFNNAVSVTTPSPGTVPTNNFVTLWAWNAVQGSWYFYSPLLESSGGLPAVKSYADGKFFLHFQDHSKTLGTGVGFWVNRP